MGHEFDTNRLLQMRSPLMAKDWSTYSYSFEMQ